MEQRIIDETAKKRGISADAVLREYYEYITLRGLYDSPIGDRIAFKGGTALRIFYGSPRYSDDLDFSILKAVEFEDFKKTARNIEKEFGEMKISDLWSKRNTFLCEFKIKETWRAMPISLKIEVSKRDAPDKAVVEIKLASSEDFGVQALGSVFKPEAIYRDKLLALKDRDEPKDYFDIWYLSQMLKLKFEPKVKIDVKRYRQVLGKYLPIKYKKVFEEIL